MAWYIDGKRVYVTSDTGWQVVPRQGDINILNSSQTIVHFAGRESYKRALVFVVFSGYAANILTLPVDSAVPLISDQGAEGDVVIRSIKSKRMTDTSRTTPVMEVTMDVTKDGV